MNYSKITGCYFSPNNSTKEVVSQIVLGISENIQTKAFFDPFTLPQQREAVREFSKEDIVVIGSPTYAGRLPNKILPDFRSKFIGNGATAILAVTFGHRAFDSSLSELQQVMTENGFQIISMGAFPCRHVFYEQDQSTKPHCLVQERIQRLVEESTRKIKTMEKPLALPAEIAGIVRPYYTPLGIEGQPVQFLKAKPQTNEDSCTHCGLCAKVCPMGSIDKNNTSLVPGTCIKCHACVSYCRSGAKFFDDEAFLSHVEYLKTNFSTPVESQVYY